MSGNVTFLDVGQGHAAVITSDGQVAVVDCPRVGADAVVASVWDAGGEGVDAIFVTHRDLDHCGGVPDLLERLSVGTVYLNFAWALPPESSARVRVRSVLLSIFSKAERDDIPIKNVYVGDSGALGDAQWQLLAPTVYDVGRTSLNDSTNRSSMVIMWSIDGRRFLIMGDADQVTINSLLSGDSDLAADVLLASHHGAKIGNTKALLERARPSFGIISVGRINGYGHPHLDTLRNFASQAGCRVMCTQVNGHCAPASVGRSSCAGTVIFRVVGGTLQVYPTEVQHDLTISGWQSPRCRDG